METFPDKEVSIRLNAATKVPQFFSPAAGDWIEAEVTPDMFAKTIHRSKPSYTMEGDILKVEGDRLLMQDPTGKEVSLRLTKDTKFEGVAKEGDQVRVEFTPDREGPSRPDRWLDRLSLRIVQSGGAAFKRLLPTSYAQFHPPRREPRTKASEPRTNDFRHPS